MGKVFQQKQKQAPLQHLHPRRPFRHNNSPHRRFRKQVHPRGHENLTRVALAHRRRA